jgi:Ala-tRNA(Pro) deacylase
MSVSPSVQEFLRRADVGYTVVLHPRAYTAKQEAAAAAVPPNDWAKVVICFADGEPLQAVVPADCDVDFDRLAKVIGVPQVRMATEDELDWLYPDCETGAMPPFGPLYRQLVFVDERLADEVEIAFNAGTFANAVVMRFADFVTLTHPTIGRFARPSGVRP